MFSADVTRVLETLLQHHVDPVGPESAAVLLVRPLKLTKPTGRSMYSYRYMYEEQGSYSIYYTIYSLYCIHTCTVYEVITILLYSILDF